MLLPKQVCTFSYLVLDSFETEEYAKNFASYMATKFARFMILQAVLSIHLIKDKFQFVPVQDYSKEWTDEELYEKYNLSTEEIGFIEAIIKPME